MFLCKDCHDEDRHMMLAYSRGKCEGCGQVRNCIDCRIRDCEPKKAEPAK